MSHSPTGSAPPTATQEATRLLKASSLVSHPNAQFGYIDTLGSLEVLGPHAIHQVCHNKTLPRIYERWWRPAVARVLFGRKGWKAAEERQITLELLDLSAGDKVLDIACGPGNYSRPFGQLVGGGLVVGLDASAEMLEAAVNKGGTNLAYVRGSGTELPFEDGSFDAAACLGALHMFDEPIKAVGEMNRVLAPGGRLVLMTTCGSRRKGSLLRRLPGVRMFDPGELPDALAGLGLIDVHQRVMGQGQFVSARKPNN